MRILVQLVSILNRFDRSSGLPLAHCQAYLLGGFPGENKEPCVWFSEPQVALVRKQYFRLCKIRTIISTWRAVQAAVLALCHRAVNWQRPCDRCGGFTFERLHPRGLASNGQGEGAQQRAERRRTNTLPGRLELPTLRLTASRSNQLSYGSSCHECQKTI